MATKDLMGFEFCLENPSNLMWDVVDPRVPSFKQLTHRFHTSYCKQLGGHATPYRKNTVFASTIEPSTPLPAPCCPSDPCRFSKLTGKHPKTISVPAGEDPGRGVNNYYVRSKIPHNISANYVEAVADKHFELGATHLLVVDLFSGGETVADGLNLFRRRTRGQRWLQRKNGRRHLAYVSVDYNEHCAPKLMRDLSEVDLDDVIDDAILAARWSAHRSTMVVLVWASPPCESFSFLNFGTNSAAGGKRRRGWEDNYRAMPGSKGSEERSTDKMVVRVISWAMRTVRHFEWKARQERNKMLVAAKQASREKKRIAEIARKAKRAIRLGTSASSEVSEIVNAATLLTRLAN